MDPNERTEHDIIEEHIDRIVYDESGRDELLEILETYHTPHIAILLNETIQKWGGYWANTPEAAAWRKEVEDMVRDHVKAVRKEAQRE